MPSCLPSSRRARELLSLRQGSGGAWLQRRGREAGLKARLRQALGWPETTGNDRNHVQVHQQHCRRRLGKHLRILLTRYAHPSQFGRGQRGNRTMDPNTQDSLSGSGSVPDGCIVVLGHPREDPQRQEHWPRYLRWGAHRNGGTSGIHKDQERVLVLKAA